MKTLANYVIFGLVLILAAQVTCAQTTLVRSVRYNYEIPDGYSIDLPQVHRSSIEDYGDLGIAALHDRVFPPRLPRPNST